MRWGPLFSQRFVSLGVNINLARFELDEAAIRRLDGQCVGNMKRLRRFDSETPFDIEIDQRLQQFTVFHIGFVQGQVTLLTLGAVLNTRKMDMDVIEALAT